MVTNACSCLCAWPFALQAPLDLYMATTKNMADSSPASMWRAILDEAGKAAEGWREYEAQPESKRLEYVQQSYGSGNRAGLSSWSSKVTERWHVSKETLADDTHVLSFECNQGSHYFNQLRLVLHRDLSYIVYHAGQQAHLPPDAPFPAPNPQRITCQEELETLLFFLQDCKPCAGGVTAKAFEPYINAHHDNITAAAEWELRHGAAQPAAHGDAAAAADTPGEQPSPAEPKPCLPALLWYFKGKFLSVFYSSKQQLPQDDPLARTCHVKHVHFSHGCHGLASPNSTIARCPCCNAHAPRLRAELSALERKLGRQAEKEATAASKAAAAEAAAAAEEIRLRDQAICDLQAERLSLLVNNTVMRQALCQSQQQTKALLAELEASRTTMAALPDEESNCFIGLLSRAEVQEGLKKYPSLLLQWRDQLEYIRRAAAPGGKATRGMRWHNQ